MELNQWFESSAGNQLAFHIKKILKPILPSLFGSNLLQLGIEEHGAWLDSSLIKHKFICTPYQEQTSCSVVSSMYELPFDEESIDVIFCPFSIELLNYRMSFLCEIDRILSANGHIIFCGINPYSLWGLSKMLPKNNSFPIWHTKLTSANSVKKDLTNLSYSIVKTTNFIYWPPGTTSSFVQRFYENLGRMILPFPTGLYMFANYFLKDFIRKKKFFLLLKNLGQHKNYL